MKVKYDKNTLEIYIEGANDGKTYRNWREAEKALLRMENDALKKEYKTDKMKRQKTTISATIEPAVRDKLVDMAQADNTTLSKVISKILKEGTEKHE